MGSCRVSFPYGCELAGDALAEGARREIIEARASSLSAPALSEPQEQAAPQPTAEAPFALTIEGARGREIYALNEAAHDAGLRAGDLLSNARLEGGRSRHPRRRTRGGRGSPHPSRPLVRALHADRLPWRDANGLDGLYLEVEGSAHLFGGEEGLVRDVLQRCARASLTPRLAIADTPGASWGIARFGRKRALDHSLGRERKRSPPFPCSPAPPRETLTLARA